MMAVSGSTLSQGRCPCSRMMNHFLFGLMGFSTQGMEMDLKLGPNINVVLWTDDHDDNILRPIQSNL